MKTQYSILLTLIFTAFVYSCGNKPAADDGKAKADSIAAAAAAAAEAPKEDKHAPTPLDGNPSLKAHMEALHAEWKDVPNPLTAKFINAELGDYFHLIFEDTAGKSYDFGDADNQLGDLELYNIVGEVNKEMVGKKFKITWEWKLNGFNCCEGAMDHVRAEIPTITQIEMVK